MNLSSAFDQYVIPALAEYHAAEVALTTAIQSKNDVAAAEALVQRRSRSAAIELHQFADRVFHEKPSWLPAPKAVQDVRDWLVTRLSGLAAEDVPLVGDVADGYKHVVLERKSAHTNGEEAATISTMGYGQGAYGAGKFGGCPQMIITTNDGRKRQLSSILLSVANSWLDAMGKPKVKTLADFASWGSASRGNDNEDAA